MLYLNAIVPLIEDAYRDLFKYADLLGDKLDYKPAETCRTPMEIVRECATTPTFLAETIANRALAAMDESAWDRKDIDTLDKAKAAWQESKGALFAAIQAFPEERLEEILETPWGNFPWRDFIAYAYWNPMWHTGQLAYIQTIHGDTDMHF
jgi:hypothetical protein